MAGLIIGVLGLIITVFGIYYTVYFRKRVEITFFYGDEISLFKKEIKGLENLEIKYKGEGIKDNLILFNGVLCNTGNVDIEGNLIHTPYKIVLPQGYEWKEVNIWDKNECAVTFSKDRNELEFSWDLMKKKECWAFNSIIEQHDDNEDPLNVNLHKRIKIGGRITNLSTKKERLIRSSDSLFFILATAIYCVVLFTCGAYFVNRNVVEEHKEVYMKFTKGTSNILVRPVLNREWTGVLTDDDIEYVTFDGLLVEKDKLEQMTYMGNEIHGDNTMEIISRIIIYVMFFGAMCWFLVGGTYYALRRRRKYKLLENALDSFNKE